MFTDKNVQTLGLVITVIAFIFCGIFIMQLTDELMQLINRWFMNII